jgi:hypothetical protein
MGRQTSLLGLLQRKNRNEISSDQGMNRWIGGLNLLGSIAFIVMILVDQPRLRWIILGVGLGLLALRPVFRWIRKGPTRPKTIDLNRIRNHRVSPYAGWMKGLHRGHDIQIDQLLKSIDLDLAGATLSKILSIQLIQGPEGTGKSHFSDLLASALFGKKNKIIFDFRTLDDGLFLEQFLSMVQVIQNNPYQLVILDHIEDASPSMMNSFLELIKQNSFTNESMRLRVSFSGCVFLVLSTTDIQESISAEHPERLASLFELAADLIDWGSFGYDLTAEIIGLQLVDYWKQHGIILEFIEPRVFLDILQEGDPWKNLGMHAYPPIIRKRSNKILHQAKLRKPNEATALRSESGKWRIAS